MEEAELWLLFTSSFLSATLLPGGSEANMLYLVTESDYSAWTLVGVATLGNVLGGCTNYALGLLAARGFRISYFEKEHRREALDRIQRYGAWALLFSWLPIVGDPLCLAAGYLRTNLWLSICA